jgi:Skp family chaperone for outer membrane proteins
MNQPTNQPSSGGPNWALVGVAIGLIAIFVVGVVGSQFLMRTIADVNDLKKNYSELKEQAGAGHQMTASPPIGLVDTARVFKEYKGFAAASQQFTAEREKKQKELEQLQKEYDSGKISSQDWQMQQAKLVADLQEIDVKLAAPIQRKMVEIIREIGREKGYLMVINNQEGNLTVLYSKENDVRDITEDVLNRMNQEP